MSFFQEHRAPCHLDIVLLLPGFTTLPDELEKVAEFIKPTRFNFIEECAILKLGRMV